MYPSETAGAVEVLQAGKGVADDFPGDVNNSLRCPLVFFHVLPQLQTYYIFTFFNCVSVTLHTV